MYLLIPNLIQHKETSQKTKKPRLIIQSPKRHPPASQLHRETVEREKHNLEVGLKDLDNLLDQWQAKSASDQNQMPILL